MNISPINSSQNFKGLWGNSNVDFIGDNMFYVIRSTTKYHPFQDETDKEIYTVSGKKYIVAPLFNDYKHAPLMDKDSVEIGERLPFTKSEYYSYKNNSADNKTKELIEKFLNMYNLKYYLNKAENTTQPKPTIKDFFKNIIKIFK